VLDQILVEVTHKASPPEWVYYAAVALVSLYAIHVGVYALSKIFGRDKGGK
jgi:hypothetical protein